MNVPTPTVPDSIPQSILTSADLLVNKTAYLSGMVAPETAVCLSRLLMVSDAEFSRIIDGHRYMPESLKNALSLAREQSKLGKRHELRRRFLAALAQHYHILRIQPLSDGNGVVARTIVNQHLAQIGLHPHLWSMSRGIARRREEYPAALAMTDRTLKIEHRGGVQPLGKATLAFIELMLDVCHGEFDYMTAALNSHWLRESVTNAFKTNSRLQKTEVNEKQGLHSFRC